MADVPIETRQRWEIVAKRLISGTRSKKLPWKTTANDSEFLLRIGSAIIVLSRVDPIEEPAYFTVIMKDRSGEERDQFSTYDIGHNVYNHDFEEAFRQIKRSLSGADEFLDQVISELPSSRDIDDDIPF